MCLSDIIYLIEKITLLGTFSSEHCNVVTPQFWKNYQEEHLTES